MTRLSGFAQRKHSLRRKLFGYMFVLAIALLILFFVGFFLIGGYTGTKARISNTLNFQSDVFERQVKSYFENLTVMEVHFSEESTEIIENYLSENELVFDDLNDSETNISGLQDVLIDEVSQKLMGNSCTGAFIMLNAQVNSSVENSRSGIYLQRNSIDSTDSHIILYRGLSDIGKAHGAMPHRKWRLEINTEFIPDYNELIHEAALPLNENYRVTNIITLPGTSERVLYVIIPVFSSTDIFYGFCGFEISESYFKSVFSQPSELSHVLFCLNTEKEGLIDSEDSFSAGIVNGYYLAPTGIFTSKPFGSLTTYNSDTNSYIGITKIIQLSPKGSEFSISTLMLKRDYDSIARKDSLRIGMLIITFVLIAFGCCIFCTRHYLTPLIQGIEKIRKKEYDSESQIAEIDDLFAFLSDQDRQSEATLEAIRKEKASVEATLIQVRNDQAESKQELKRLAYSRKTEVDPDDYKVFLSGIKELTKTEKKIFDYYLDGKTVKEITELMGVKESTIRFHNRNIYMTLGVSSLKQLLRYSAIMKHENEK